MARQPMQRGIKILGAEKNLSKFTYFLRSSHFLENVMYAF